MTGRDPFAVCLPRPPRGTGARPPELQCLISCVHVRSPSRLLIYGEYCSHMEHAQNTLNQLLASREDFRQKVEVMGASRLVPRSPAPCLSILWKGGHQGSNGMVSVDVFLDDFFPFGGRQVQVTVPGPSPLGASDSWARFSSARGYDLGLHRPHRDPR